jgi:hypothetical protein
VPDIESGKRELESNEQENQVTNIGFESRVATHWLGQQEKSKDLGCQDREKADYEKKDLGCLRHFRAL